jgi:hypothetical protein
MPALQDLMLHMDDYHGHDFIGNILCCLIHHSAEPCIIPKLMYLDLGLWDLAFKFKYKTLIDMIQSQWRIVDHDGDGVSDKPTLDMAHLQVVILKGIIPK